jgi:hypothetical protein
MTTDSTTTAALAAVGPGTRERYAAGDPEAVAIVAEAAALVADGIDLPEWHWDNPANPRWTPPAEDADNA